MKSCPVAELSRRETEGLWLKFMPAAVAKAGEGGRVTFAGFLESIKAFEACLRRGEVPVSYTHLTLPTILLV